MAACSGARPCPRTLTRAADTSRPASRERPTRARDPRGAGGRVEEDESPAPRPLRCANAARPPRGQRTPATNRATPPPGRPPWRRSSSSRPISAPTSGSARRGQARTQAPGLARAGDDADAPGGTRRRARRHGAGPAERARREAATPRGPLRVNVVPTHQARISLAWPVSQRRSAWTSTTPEQADTASECAPG